MKSIACTTVSPPKSKTKYSHCVSGLLKHNVSKTGFYLRVQVELPRLDPADRATPVK
jgi:hypothetical protein